MAERNLADHPAAGKSPVHSIEVEQALLGAVILNNDAYFLAERRVSAYDFYELLHQELWKAFAETIGAGHKTDVKLLIARLGALGDVVKLPSSMTLAKYVASLAGNATGVIMASDYATVIRDLADKRRIGSIAALAEEQSRQDSVKPEDLASQAIDALDGVVSKRVLLSLPRVDARQAVARAVDAVAQAYQRDGAITGITWGVKALDAKTLGMQRGEFTVAAGRPGMGKTALAVSVTRMTAEAGNRVLLCSLEMGDIALTQRILSDHMYALGIRMPYWLLRQGRIGAADFEHITDAARTVAEFPITIEQRPGLTASQIAALARQHKRREGLDMLVVDHMHLIKPGERYAGNRVAEVGESSAALKGIAKELDIAVLALCQLSRQVEGREDKRPGLSDLRWSGDIEQDADLIIMLFREAYYLSRMNPAPQTKEHEEWQVKLSKCHQVLEVGVEKQRNGPIGRLNLFCSIECNAVRDPETPDAGRFL